MSLEHKCDKCGKHFKLFLKGEKSYEPKYRLYKCHPCGTDNVEDLCTDCTKEFDDLMENYFMQNSSVTDDPKNNAITYCKHYHRLLADFYAITDLILGPQYYNLGCDVPTSHRLTREDAMHKWGNLKRRKELWKRIAIVMSIAYVINVIMQLITALV